MRVSEIFAIVIGLMIIATLGTFVGFVVLYDSHDDSDKPPHIILIVADDLGWNDVSFHGADQIPTPNVDALAYNGVILNRHYVFPTSTPSRTSLMTGRYAIRDGMQGPPLSPGVPKGIPLNVILMPEHLRRLGYVTRLLGKWDVGYYTEDHTPTRRGFDTFFGYYTGLVGYFNKTTNQLRSDGSEAIGYDLHRDGPNGLSNESNSTEYFTDLITDEAERIIKANGNNKPLFLEITHLAAHAIFSKVNSLEVRNSTENDETFAYIKDEKRRRLAGIIKALDESVERVVKALSAADMLDNSIIVFMSDNGAPSMGFLKNSGSNYPLRGMKKMLFEGGIRSATFIFSPLIVNAPRISDDYFHVSDWLPTLYSAAGGNIRDLGEIDGIDQWESLAHHLPAPRDRLLINIDERANSEAAILDRYKLVKENDKSIVGYYEDDTGSDLTYPAYNWTKVLNSTTARAISRIFNFKSTTRDYAKQLRDSAVVRCQHPTNYSKCMGTCLFDIVSDPCETQDLSKSLPEVLASLKSFVDSYRKFILPQTDYIVDPCSFPEFFHGNWMPWRKNDANSTAIIPESLCNPQLVSRNNPIYRQGIHNRTGLLSIGPKLNLPI